MKDSFKQTVLGSLVEDYGLREYPDAKADDIFERFVVTEVLKPKILSPDDVESGIVDGRRDGGVDAVFTFLNGTLLSEDSDYLVCGSEAAKNLSKQSLIEVVIIQSKNKDNWEELAWGRFLSSLPSLLDPEASDEDLLATYNNDVVLRTGIYRQAMRALAVRFPRVKVGVFYATRAPEANISATIKKNQADLERLLKKEVLAEAELTTTCVGVNWLYGKSNEPGDRSGVLVFDDLIRTDGAYIGTVTLDNYMKFLQGQDGYLEQELFEANVRDYEGANRVNESIAATLKSDDSVEFWWRNNGITILATDVNCPTNTMTLDQPYIVNGLQTSYVLANSFRENQVDAMRLMNRVVVRIIVSTDNAVRDAVISGTNMQTAISSDSLHASDAIQSDIERYFLAHGWYYERRKNYYKNQSMPAAKRVSIVYLSQAIMTLALGEPHTARARPTTLLTQKGGYERVFDAVLDCDAYLAAVKVMKEVDEYLKSDAAKSISDDRTNSRYYVALAYYMILLHLDSLEKLHFGENARRIKFPLDAKVLDRAHRIVTKVFNEFEDAPSDKLAKRQETTKALVGLLAT